MSSRSFVPDKYLSINSFGEPDVSFNYYWWGNSCSTKFRVTNEVKLGGTLSTALFNVYMNNLSVSLNYSGIGGFLGGNLINHLGYADNLCLVVLSSSEMQCLLCANPRTK